MSSYEEEEIYEEEDDEADAPLPNAETSTPEDDGGDAAKAPAGRQSPVPPVNLPKNKN